MTETRAEIRLPTQELRDDLPFFTKVLRMRLDMIYPADNPEVAVLSGHGLRLRIQKGAPEAPGTLRILTDDPTALRAGERELTAPERHQGRDRRAEPAAGAAGDRTCLRRAPPGRSGALGDRAGGDAVSRSGARRALAGR